MHHPALSTASLPTSVIEGMNKPLNFFQDGNFYIYGGFDDTIMTEIVPALVREIDARSKLKEACIKFFIDSNGGYADCTKNIVSLFEVAKAQGIIIETYVLGKAFSAGSLTACAGSKGHRYIGPYAEHLCHLGSSSTGRIRNDTELEREAAAVKAHFNHVRDLYRKYAKVKNLDRVIHNDSYFIRGQDIIANGLADKML